MDKLEEKIKKLCNVVRTLTELALEIGTLIVVIRMIFKQ